MANSVQHNISAINANRNFGITKGILKSSTEKLSSGYKINRAADDAAGLAISEKMRKQIRGLTQASANAQDGISSVQTAEGALTEVHAMLQRMNELATKAANGTQSENDKQYVQDEVDQLLTEIDRVAETTKFNEIYLLKGNSDKSTKTIEVNAHDAGLAGNLTDKGDGTVEFKLDKALANGDTVKIGGADYTIGKSVTKGNFRDNESSATDGFGYSLMTSGDSITVGGSTYTLTNDVDLSKAKAWTSTGANSWTAGDIIRDTNGIDHVISIATAAIAAGAAELEKGASAIANGTALIKDYDADGDGKAGTMAISEALSAGWTIIKQGKDTTQHEIVGSLSEGDISIRDNNLVGKDVTANNVVSVATGSVPAQYKEGDTIVQGSNTITATDAKPENYSTIRDKLSELAADGSNAIQIKHTENGVETTSTFILSTATDLDNPVSLSVGGTANTSTLKASREYILDQIHDLDEVTFYTGSVDTNYDTANTDLPDQLTIVGKDNTKDANVITINDAYNKMADALKEASSIGADAGKEATVKNNADGSFLITKGSVEVKNALEFSLHVGSDADMTNKIGVKIESMDTAGLGIKNLKVSGDTVANATYAIDAIEDAINKVSSQRSALGAAQNRLEHTIKNLDNIVENTTAAEQEIRDTDMATEMVKFSNANILAQAGQSMLAQANQGNQGILSLLG